MATLRVRLWFSYGRSPKDIYDWAFVLLSMLRSTAERGHRWMCTFPSRLGFLPAPAPKAVSSWDELWQEASDLFAKKTVE